ncbi:S8 family peptidase [Kytococcus sp. Marseille-QA3725]
MTHIRSIFGLAAAATLTLGTGAATATPAFNADAGAPKAEVMDASQAGDYIVMLNLPKQAAGDLSTASAKAAVASTTETQVAKFSDQGMEVQNELKSLGGFTANLTAEQVKDLENDPAVASVTKSKEVTASESQTDATWGLDRVDQEEPELDQTYNYEGTGEGVNSYVIDTGVRSTHSDFEGRVSEGFSAIDDGQGTEDCNGHGTHVAGTMGGKEFGVAKGTNLIPVRVLSCEGSGSTDGIITAMDWVIENKGDTPSVANMSLGGGVDEALDEAIGRMTEAGVVTAVAAGNDTDDACNYSPARAESAITVGSTAEGDMLSDFSNFGECVDILAPGTDITSAWMDSDDATNTISGTSMASPHVAGGAALALEKNPDATVEEVTTALTESATKDAIEGVNGSPNLLLNALKVSAG